MLTSGPPPKSQEEYFHTLDEVLISSCALTAEDFNKDIHKVIHFCTQAIRLTRQHNMEMKVGLSLSTAIFLCDVLKLELQPFELILGSNIYLLLAEALVEIAKEMNASDIAKEPAKEHKPWRLIEFFGYGLEQCIVNRERNSFFSKENIEQIAEALQQTAIACFRQGYNEGLHYCFPTLYQLLSREGPERNLSLMVKANPSFIELLKKLHLKVVKGELPAEGRVADYTNRLMSHLRL